jgi:hypothetical protein
MEADPSQEMHAYMQELFTAVLEIAAPDLQPIESSVCRGHQPANQPAAQLTEQSRKELSSGEVSGVMRELRRDEHSTQSDRAEASGQGGVTPLSHPKDDISYQQLVGILATLKDNKYFLDLGHLGSESGVSGGEASGQMQNENEQVPVQSSNLSKEVSLSLNHQISRKLQELQAVCKELEDLLHMKMLAHPDQVSASDETKSQAQTGTAEEEPHIEQERMTDSRIEPCNLTDPKREESAVSKSKIKGHSDGEKTTFDESTLHGIPIPYVCEHLASKLNNRCRQLRAMCETLSSVLLSTLESFLASGIIHFCGARRCLQLAEVACILIGCSSQLRSAVELILDNILFCSVNEMAYLSLAIKQLTEIFPLLETLCRNMYADYLQLQQPCDCRKDPGAGKNGHLKVIWKADKICQQVDVADEQLEKAIQKLNIILDNEAAAPEIPALPLQPETESKQGNSKVTFLTIVRKLLLIEEHISSLLDAWTLQGQDE